MIICPWFYDGQLNGIGRVSSGFYNTILSMGYQLQVLSANDPASTCPPDKGFGYDRNYPGMMLAALTQRFHPPRLILCMHLGLSPVARILSCRYQVPYFVFVHGIEAWKKLPFRSQWGLLEAHNLLTNSHFTLRHFHAYNPNLSQLPAVIVPLGIGDDVPDSNEPVSELTTIATPRILIVGRLVKGERYKGHEVLIRSLGLVLVEQPQTRLTIIGDGDYRQDLEQLAAQFPYREQIEFLGRVPDSELSKLYASSTIFAMPSESEGFGLVYLEAMAHGLSCICSDTDAAREVVVHGETGFAVDPRNPFDLAERILQLLRQPEQRHRMGEAGRQRYLNYFTAKHFQARIESTLQPYLI